MRLLATAAVILACLTGSDALKASHAIRGAPLQPVQEKVVAHVTIEDAGGCCPSCDCPAPAPAPQATIPPLIMVKKLHPAGEGAAVASAHAQRAQVAATAASAAASQAVQAAAPKDGASPAAAAHLQRAQQAAEVARAHAASVAHLQSGETQAVDAAPPVVVETPACGCNPCPCQQLEVEEEEEVPAPDEACQCEQCPCQKEPDCDDDKDLVTAGEKLAPVRVEGYPKPSTPDAAMLRPEFYDGARPTGDEGQGQEEEEQSAGMMRPHFVDEPGADEGSDDGKGKSFGMEPQIVDKVQKFPPVEGASKEFISPQLRGEEQMKATIVQQQQEE